MKEIEEMIHALAQAIWLAVGWCTVTALKFMGILKW
jgi:hypothetical protein